MVLTKDLLLHREQLLCLRASDFCRIYFPFIPSPGPCNTIRSQILHRGDLQINAPERAHHLSSLNREIATLVSEMTVDPATSRKHTVTIIEKTMAEIGYNVKADRPAKAQALELIKKLSEEGSPLGVRRVRMRVRVTMPGKEAKRVKERILMDVEEVEEEEMGAEWEAVSSRPVLISVGVGLIE